MPTMRQRNRDFLALLTVALWALACGPRVEPVALGQVPRPAIDRLDETARGRIEEIRARLDQRLASAPDSPELAADFGELGRLYLAYDFRNAAVASFDNAARLRPREFRWRYLLAVARQQDGDLETAADDLESCLALNPREVAVLLRLGGLQVDLGRLEEARSQFTEAARLDPTAAAAAHGLGRIAALEQDHAAAVKHFERTLELQPEATAVRHALGLAYRRSGDLDRARELLESGAGSPVRFEDPLTDALGRLVSGDVSLQLAAGSREASEGNYARAEAHFLRALEIDPDEVRARDQLAAVLGRQGRHGEAILQLEAILKRDPDHRDARFNLATALSRQGKTVAAIESFSAVLELDPSDHDARLRRALLAITADRAELAQADLDRLLKDDPNDVESLLALAGLEQRTGRMDEAVQVYRGIQELDPSSPASYLGVYGIRLRERRYGEARRELETGLARLPDHPQMTDRLARLLATCPDPAVRESGRALELARANHAAHPTFDHTETLALALAEAGDFTSAQAHQQELLEGATAQGAPEALLARLRRHLDLYRQNQPIRGGVPETR